MRPKRLQHALADETSTPPAELPSGLIIAKVIRVEGKNLYTVEQPIGGLLLVEMPAKFRSTVWVKRGTFVVIDTQVLIGRENKLGGEISNVVTNEKLWRKQGYWPAEFSKPVRDDDRDTDDEVEGDDSLTGHLPPPDSDLG